MQEKLPRIAPSSSKMLQQASNKDMAEQKKEQKKAVVALVDKTGGAQIPKVGVVLKPHFTYFNGTKVQILILTLELLKVGVVLMPVLLRMRTYADVC
jgi:hypothetical protein